MRDVLDLSRLTPSDLPARFGRFELLAVLGQGGMGRVFEAEIVGPVGFRRPVALKVLKRPSNEAAAELGREARLAGLLHHPNLVSVQELGEIEGTWFAAMELVRGASVQQLLRSRRTLSYRATLDVALQACAGLGHAHALALGGERTGLVHCDIKPGNLLIDAQGVVKVADFGIARPDGGADAVVRGTPAYMSPEQAAGLPVTARSDLFSLGTVLVRMVTGRSPFARATTAATVRALNDVDGLRGELISRVDEEAPGLGDVVGRCLRRDPQDRYADADTLASALLRLLPAATGPQLSELFDGARFVPELGEQTGHLSDSPTQVVTGVGATNLPPESTPFVGRAALLEALLPQLESGWTSLVGEPGIGKTRLALKLARGLEPKGGVWFVDADEAGTENDLARRIAIALALPLADASRPLARVAHSLAARGKTLLVLDGVDPSLGAALTEVSHTAPGCALLVTCRRAIGEPAERVVHVPPLSASEAAELLPAIDPDVVARIVAQVGGSPRALELAAPHLRSGQGERVLDELRSQTSLPAWSFGRLTPYEQLALVQLAPCRVGVYLDDAERLLDLGGGAPPASAVLQRLLDAAVLERVASAHGPRIRVLEVSGRFAASVLASAWPAALDRHATWYAQQADPIGAGSLSGRAVEARVTRAAPDLGNLLAAADHLLEVDDLQTALGAVLGIVQLLIRTGPLGAGVERLERILQRLAPDARRRPAALLALADLRARGGDRPGALPHAEEALRLALARAEPLLESEALQLRGYIRTYMGDHPGARGDLERAFDVARRHGAPRLQMQALEQLGWLEHESGDRRSARRFLEATLDLAALTDDPRTERSARITLGGVLTALGLTDEGRQQLELALELARGMGDLSGQATALGNLANNRRQDGDPGAEALYRHCLALFRVLGARRNVAITLLNLGADLHGRSQLDEASALYAEGEALLVELGDPGPASIAASNQARIDAIRRGPLAAVPGHQRSLVLARQAGVPDGVVSALLLLARAMLKADLVTPAAERLWDALCLDRIPDARRAEVYAALAEARARMGDEGPARALIDRCAGVIADANPVQLVEVHLACGRALLALSDVDGAERAVAAADLAAARMSAEGARPLVSIIDRLREVVAQRRTASPASSSSTRR